MRKFRLRAVKIQRAQGTLQGALEWGDGNPSNVAGLFRGFFLQPCTTHPADHSSLPQSRAMNTKIMSVYSESFCSSDSASALRSTGWLRKTAAISWRSYGKILHAARRGKPPVAYPTSRRLLIHVWGTMNLRNVCECHAI